MNSKNNSNIINFSLGFLIVLLLVQASLLWFKFSMPQKKIDSGFKSKEASMDVFMPSMLIVNLGYRQHYVLKNFKDYWKIYSTDISEVLENSTNENLEMIDTKTYLNLQKNESLVFKFSSPLSGSILLNLLGENKLENNINLSINSIYISKDNDVYIGATNNYFKLKNLKTNLEMNRLLKNAKKIGTNYINFKEAYNINKDLLIPDSNYIQAQDIYYKLATDILDDNIKNNLAVRYLQTNIDYIKEIKQSEKTTYVYENKYISFYNNGIVEYNNEENFSVPNRNLYGSIVTALEFLFRNSGMTANIYLDKIVPVNYKDSNGYKFFFNLKESGLNLILNSKDNTFIEMEVFSDHVKSYREYYYKKDFDPATNTENLKILDILEIINNNLSLFNLEKTEDVLTFCNNLSLVYINKNENLSSKLNMAYEFSINDKKYYFDVLNGELILSR